MVLIFLNLKRKTNLHKLSIYLLKGDSSNDFIDRDNNPVILEGDKYTKYFGWGNKWRVEDDSPDADPNE